ncbi:hypothetical protein ALC53_04600 [Atta colombica]|uniref:Uncharacterized protein n=1 Tax=Atta colombica TaxID=520822 RepID=A0A195BKZ9_9HYME|nr:hypothetical protein ALC53_04600 [Atta colombica]
MQDDLLQRCLNIDLREQRLPFLLSKMQNSSGQPAYSSTRVMLGRGIANLRPRFYDLRFMAIECMHRSRWIMFGAIREIFLTLIHEV